jgi:hypothetical protein
MKSTGEINSIHFFIESPLKICLQIETKAHQNQITLPSDVGEIGGHSLQVL